jgi:hypothetical protein
MIPCCASSYDTVRQENHFVHFVHMYVCSKDSIQPHQNCDNVMKKPFVKYILAWKAFLIFILSKSTLEKKHDFTTGPPTRTSAASWTRPHCRNARVRLQHSVRRGQEPDPRAAAGSGRGQVPRHPQDHRHCLQRGGVSRR